MIIKQELLNMAKNDNVNVRINIAKNKSTPEEILKAYLTDKEYDVIKSLALNPSLTIELIDILLDMEDSEIYENLLKNDNINLAPIDYKKILDNTNPLIDNNYETILTSKELPISVYEYYLSYCNPKLPMILKMIQNENIKLDTLKEIFKGKNLEILLISRSDIKISNNISDLPLSQLKLYLQQVPLSLKDYKIIEDKIDESVLRILSLNSNIDNKVVSEMFKHPLLTDSIINNILSNCKIPKEVFEKYLLEDNQILISNKNIISDQLLAMYKNNQKDTGIIRMILRNLNCPDIIKDRYSDSSFKGKYDLDIILGSDLNSDNINLKKIINRIDLNQIDNLEVEHLVKTILLKYDLPNSKAMELSKTSNEWKSLFLLNDTFTKDFDFSDVEVAEYSIPKRYYGGLLPEEKLIVEDDVSDSNSKVDLDDETKDRIRNSSLNNI